MSWDSYLDNMQAQSGTPHMDLGTIIGIDGGGSWISPDYAINLKLEGQEGANIARCFKNKDFTTFMSNGILIAGVKYQFLREEDGKIVYGKKKDNGAVTLQCSKTAIVIGHCPEGGQQGSTNKGVGVIADYLESMDM